jgi:hypothetical protein
VAGRTKAHIPRGVIERGDGLERALGAELVDEELMVHVGRTELFQREGGEERAVLIAAFGVDLEEAPERLCARWSQRSGLLELDDRGRHVTLGDEQLCQGAARVTIVGLQLRCAREGIDGAWAVTELVTAERAESFAQVEGALDVAPLGVTIDEPRVDALELVPLREPRADGDERDEGLLVRGVLLERGFEKPETAGFVAKAAERDVGLGKAQKAALA